MASRNKNGKKIELAAIYRLEFYKKQQKWKLSDEKVRKQAKPASEPSNYSRSANKLNETYNIDEDKGTERPSQKDFKKDLPYSPSVEHQNVLPSTSKNSQPDLVSTPWLNNDAWKTQEQPSPQEFQQDSPTSQEVLNQQPSKIQNPDIWPENPPNQPENPPNQPENPLNQPENPPNQPENAFSNCQPVDNLQWLLKTASLSWTQQPNPGVGNQSSNYEFMNAWTEPAKRSLGFEQNTWNSASLVAESASLKTQHFTRQRKDSLHVNQEWTDNFHNDPGSTQNTSDFHKSSESYQKPSDLFQKPFDLYQKPSDLHQKPYDLYQKPSDPYQKPSDLYQKPSYPYQKPSDLYQKPSYPYQKPSDPYQKASDSHQKQSDSYQKPSDTYQKTTTDLYQISSDTNQESSDPYQKLSDPYQKQYDPYQKLSDPYQKQYDLYQKPTDLQKTLTPERVDNKQYLPDLWPLQTSGSDRTGKSAKIQDSSDLMYQDYSSGTQDNNWNNEEYNGPKEQNTWYCPPPPSTPEVTQVWTNPLWQKQGFWQNDEKDVGVPDGDDMMCSEQQYSLEKAEYTTKQDYFEFTPQQVLENTSECLQQLIAMYRDDNFIEQIEEIDQKDGDDSIDFIREAHEVPHSSEIDPNETCECLWSGPSPASLSPDELCQRMYTLAQSLRFLLAERSERDRLRAETLRKLENHPTRDMNLFGNEYVLSGSHMSHSTAELQSDRIIQINMGRPYRLTKTLNY